MIKEKPKRKSLLLHIVRKRMLLKAKKDVRLENLIIFLVTGQKKKKKNEVQICLKIEYS